MCKILKDIFSDIADAIRAKKGTSNTITPDNMAGEIEGIPTGDNWCGEYDPRTSYYHPNAIVSYNGNIYRAMVNTPNLPTDTADWVKLNADDDEWKGEYTGSPYYEGNIVYYKGDIYRANTATDHDPSPTDSDWDMLNDRAKISDIIPTFTGNGTYLASADGFDGYKGVTIAVPTSGSGGGSGTSEPVKLQGKTVTKNGFVRPDTGYDGLSYVDVDIEHRPLSVTANGTYTASDREDSRGNPLAGFSKVTVNVPIPSGYVQPSGIKTILTDGTHDVTNYANAYVPIKPNIIITKNGVYDITDESAKYAGYASIEVDVPTSSEIPDGYLKPTGVLQITKNGAVDVSSFATANVQVPIPSGYVQPSGIKTILTDGTHDVTNFAKAYVPIKPNIIITKNGVYDITDESAKYAGYASIEVDVPTSGSGGSEPTLVDLVLDCYLTGINVAYTTYTNGVISTVSKTLTEGENHLACVDKTHITIAVDDTNTTISSNYSGGKIGGNVIDYSWVKCITVDSSLDGESMTGYDAFMDIS